MKSRRAFIKTVAAGSVAAGTMLNSKLLEASPIAYGPPPSGQPHALPDLPYAYDALEPYIDAETMKLHHDKHHQGYVNGLNKAEAELAKCRESKDYSLIQHWSRQLAFNGGGHWLHSMFWKTMAPNGKGGGGLPGGIVAEAIKDSFGDFDQFAAHFSAAAGAVEGSGWALLHFRYDDQKLVIMQAENQQKLSAWGSVPILGVDVWEHAYYIKYQNKRADYVKAWWNVVNWGQVEKNLLWILNKK
ncbi:MAG: superoxide dismutase [Ignavibacteria bacterium]|nr:superoxide dismutase [Ignavibacteria bacterium]